MVADPFRWLEDLESTEVARWAAAQQGRTEAFLARLPRREVFRSLLAQAWDHPRAEVPFQRGERWFQERNTGLQDHDVLYVASSPGEPGRALVDPNTFSEDGTVSVNQYSVSPGGRLVAYALSTAGSDWLTWRVRDVATGSDLPDTIRWSKFANAAWAGDESGFYYTRSEQPPPGQELTAATGPTSVMFHHLGSAQVDDEVVYDCAEHPDWEPGVEVTEDGRYLVVTVNIGTAPEARVDVMDLERPAAGFAPLVEGFVCRAEVVCNVGEDFWFLTDAAAPRCRLVRSRPGRATPGTWQEVVPEQPEVLVGVANCGGRLACHYLRDASSAVVLHDPDGRRVGELAVPGLSSLSQVYSAAGAVGRHDAALAHFKVRSFTSPGRIWQWDTATGRTSPLPLVGAPAGAGAEGEAGEGEGDEGAELVTERAMVEVAGLGRVPLFLTHRRDVQPDGDTPALLWGYGGFNIPITPMYSPWAALFARLGGLSAVAVLPGGGEYGREWFDVGRLAHKQNVFDAFSECARWLTASGWSRPACIAVNGGSNGGLLVAACLVQHPELFGAAVPEVGVLDMLRFHLFTIGWAWKSDFGDPVDPEQYRWLRSYSPVHNIRPGTRYPPVMVVTADHDDRVVPAHSFKFAAALQQQEVRGSAGPVLLRVEASAGHGHGMPTSKLVAERADVLAFLDWAVGPLERRPLAEVTN